MAKNIYDPKDNFVRLPLQKGYNARELGGYAGRKGRVTKYHAFLRTDGMQNLTKSDIVFLKEYGLTAVIDLRGEDEAIASPSKMGKDPDVDYINIPFITDGITDMRAIKEHGFYVPTFYIDLVESYDLVKQIFDFIDEHEDGVVAFHCMAGKDRTGIVAMLLLGLAGVSKEDIIANYEVTYTYLKDHVTMHLREGLEELHYSKAEWMEETYDHIIKKYGTFKKYFKAVGLEKEQIKRLRNRMI